LVLELILLRGFVLKGSQGAWAVANRVAWLANVATRGRLELVNSRAAAGRKSLAGLP